MIEAYDLDQAAASQLANISTRAFVSTGSNIVIAGFILGNNTGAASIVVRGIGPSLTGFGVPDALANPTLELRNSNGALLTSNNDWQDDPTQAAIISAAGLAPTNPLESGIAKTLSPGQYTALLAGLNNGTGRWLGGSLQPRGSVSRRSRRKSQKTSSKSQSNALAGDHRLHRTSNIREIRVTCRAVASA